ncbi:MAG: hypothetical protein R2835_02620 [Thermomicrobiales bacterium]
MATDSYWFQRFVVESEDRTDTDVVWADQTVGPTATRKPTRAEKLSIILVGVTAIGFIVLMVVTVIVAVYISRR